MSKEKKKLLKTLRRAIRNSPRTYAQIARRSGITPSIIDHIGAGCYPHVPAYTRVVKLLAAVR
jgi:hypothetical protein